MTSEPIDNITAAKPKHKKALKVILIVLLSLFLVLCILVITFFALRASGKKQFHAGGNTISVPTDIVDDSENDGKTVTYKNQKYVFDEDVISILFMGVDKKSVADNLGYGKNGQADSIFLISLNTKTGGIKVIPISREVMVDVNEYTKSGTYSGVKREQICLAYAYGDTPENCSDNVMKSVSRLFYGINIGSYITMDISGFEKLNDMIGGVTLTPIETLSKYNITEGKEITLKGSQATYYIRERGNDLEANARRMLRQKHYMTTFASQAGNQVMKNVTKLVSYYNAAKPYMVTDLTVSEVTYLASCALVPNVGKSIEYLSISGEHIMGEKYVEFVADDTSVYETVLSAFYKLSDE